LSPPPRRRPGGTARPPARPASAPPPAPAPVAAAARTPAPPAELVPEPAPLVAAAAPEAPAAASAPASEPPAASAPAGSAAAGVPAGALAFDWPPSTRLDYDFEGYYRGPAYGSARVDWLREGDRYQVRLEVRIPPVGARRMLSDGRLGPQGLVPLRYDEETDQLFRTTRQTVRFEDGRVQLANGKDAPLPEGVQDTASQFVQMTWLFLTGPDRLQPGRVVEFPLALPRRVGRWTYDVRPAERLSLPFGEVDAVPLEPRPQSRRGNEWLVHIWVAPSLQYLPVKIVLRQSAESYGEMRLKRPPLQAAPVR
uniref:DUF3108 domain-containing protein n=1 Tax=Ideonella sp. TaxID=1929293 RepID=UPI0035B4AC53